MSQSPLSDALMGYSPIIGKNRSAIATRLSFMGRNDKVLSATRIYQALQGLWPESATPVLVDMGDDMPDESLLELSASPMLWLEVPGRLAGSSEGLELIRGLHARGFTLVMRGRPAAAIPEDLLPGFKLALIHVDEDRRLTESPEKARAQAEQRLIPYAQAGVRSIEQMSKCFDTGAEAVIGWPFDDALDHAGTAASSPDFMTISRLLQMIDRGDDAEEMEAEVRGDPALAFRLLRYINSPAFGLRVEVQSFKHALMMLGTKNLKKWLALLLSTSSKNANLRPVMFASFRRGLFLEQLVGDIDPEARDEVFILGVFSLLDKMFSEPFKELLGLLKLPDRVQESLVDDRGPYSPYLNIVRAVELGPDPKLSGLLDNALISLDRCNVAIVRALTGPVAGEAA